MKPTSITTTTTNSNSLTMESLALPRELYWDGKMEPTSPLSNELFSISEPSVNWLYDDNFANGITIITDDDIELKPGMELDFPHELIDGDDIVIELCDLKKEWSDSKLLSPTLPLEYQIGAIIPQPNTITKVNHNTFNIGILDSSILTTLTPPQSPPQNNVSPVATTLQAIISTESQNNLHHNNNVLQQQQQQQQSSQTVLPVTSNAISLTTSSSPSATSVQNVNFYGNQASVNANIPEISDDIARETQIVDEILKIRAKELLDWNADECESQSSFSAPSQIGSIEDDDWLPDSYSYSSASSSPVHLSGEEHLQNDLPTSASFSSSSSIASTSSSSSSLPTKKRTRPYGRGVEDRKIRKKEQNKNAATRYRQKKKVEMECVLSEESILLQRNEELKVTLADRKREAKYLKELLREMYNKK